MRTISFEEYEKIKYEVITIDVRTRQEFKVLEKLKWAENVPIDELLENTEKYLPDKSKTVITICNAGNRSSTAANSLYEMGYDAYVLNGGIYGYKRKFGK